MSTLLKGGTLVEFEPANVEVADLRVDRGVIVERGQGLEPHEGEDVVDIREKIVFPGLVSTHHHLFTSIGRGLPRAKEGSDYEQAQEATSWRLESALDLDSVQAAAMLGALEALTCGTTTLLDAHSSPKAIRGSLTRVARGVNEVGLRAVLSYQVTDRHGALGREEGIEENVHFLKKARGRFRGMVGAHASFTLSADALEGVKQAVKETGSGLHLNLAEDPVDERLSFQRYGEVPVARLAQNELLGPKSLLAHVVHLSWPDLSQVISTGAWISHNPRSNMNLQVGYAPAGKFGARASLGTAGLVPDLFSEAQLAMFRSRDAGQPIDVLRYLANGHRIATEQFGVPIGPLREGAVADLIVLDYRPVAPLDGGSLALHLVEAISSRHVEAVMVDGVWRMWARRPLSVNPEAVIDRARDTAQAVHARMQEAASS